MKAPRAPALGVFLVAFGLFLGVTGRERPYGDARIVYEVASAMARGSIAIQTEWPPMSHRGDDGRIYSQYAILPSLLHVPGRLLYTAIWGDREPATPAARMGLVLTSHLSTAAAAALTCALLFALAARLASRRAALITAAIAGGASLLFVYARYPMSEAVQAACVMGLLGECVRIAAGEHTLRRGVGAGAWAGAAVNAKLVLVLGVAGALVVLAIAVRERKALGRLAAGVALGGAPWLALVLAYNHARWGSPFATGYSETLGLMNESITSGLHGLLLSPGKGLLWFSPTIVLCAIAMYRAWATDRVLVLLVLGLVVPPLLFYARFLSWSGDYCWGPRYLVFALAPLAVPLAPWLAAARSRLAAWLVRAVIIAGVLVQLVGASMFWDHWIRLSREARIEWLGAPNRSGAVIAEAGRGHCDSCFEDMYGHQWLPALSPIRGTAWLAWNRLAGTPWSEAVRSAPWRRYTSLALRRPQGVYEHARIDLWAADAPAHVLASYALVAALLVAAGLALARR